MNEFTAKKLAEVEAFCKVSGVITQKAGQAFKDQCGSVADALNELSTKSVASAVADDQKATFDAKLDKTVAKLSQMMELYVGDEWDNPVEVLEWSSFFTGAAAAHCALASQLNDDLQSQLDSMRAQSEEALQQVIVALKAVGTERKQQA